MPYFKTTLLAKRLLSSGYFGVADSTIFALASGGIRCALAVVRVSGPKSGNVLQEVGRFESVKKLPDARKATLRKLYDITASKKYSNVIDHSIVLWFPAPKSFTGEDSCEFHVHGGSAVIASLLRSISSIPGCRLAEPGEFTRRAFLNGKMDLTEVEGLGDLISAETEMQRTQALRQMSGSLGKLYESWRNRIARCLANAEAYIDFGEDENIEDDIVETIEKEINALIAEINSHLKDEKKGQRLRNGVRVAILGQPNVGKSSLLNILCKRDAAIVSNTPGTTRDVVETCINLGGFPVVIADTAGIRSKPGDDIELQGIRKSIKEAHQCDLIILLVDHSIVQSSKAETKDTLFQRILNENVESFITTSTEQLDLQDLKSKTIFVLNKVDLVSSDSSHLTCSTPANVDCKISCKTTEGIDFFLDLLTSKVSTLCANPKSESAYLTQERYRSHLNKCVESLSAYLQSSEQSDLALRAYCLRQAINNIGYITGHFGPEQILDIIFKEFCIGK